MREDIDLRFGGLLAGGTLGLFGDLLSQRSQLESVISAGGNQTRSPARHARLRNSRVPSDVSLSQAVLAGQRINDVFGSRHKTHSNARVHLASTHSCIARWA